MRAGIIQSDYIPWRGYFDFINSVDLFIIHDDLQYTKGDWRNRNKIKTPYGLKWLTVPVKYHKTTQLICNTEIDYSSSWQDRHLNLLRSNYGQAKYFTEAIELFKEGLSYRDVTISELNVRLIKMICKYLAISTPIVMSSEFQVAGTKTERLIQLLRKAYATSYLSGPSARSYLEEDLFRENSIQLEYKNYDYDPYPQLWGDFDGKVSILDLIANCGPDAGKFILSLTGDKVTAG